MTLSFIFIRQEYQKQLELSRSVKFSKLSIMQARSAQTFVIATVSLSLVVWNLAFNLGAFDTIFFDKMFSVWVICTVLLLTQIVLPKTYRKLTILGALALFAPSFWVILQYLDVMPGFSIEVSELLYLLSFILTIICLPYTVYLVMSFLQEEVVALRPRRLMVWLFVITASIGLVGYFVDANNDIFLFCEDFKVSGNDLPTNCYANPQAD